MKSGFDISFFGDKALEGETIEGKPLSSNPFGVYVGMPVSSDDASVIDGIVIDVRPLGHTVKFTQPDGKVTFYEYAYKFEEDEVEWTLIVS